MERLDTNGYYALGAPLYVALVVAEAAVARKRGRSIYSWSGTVSNFMAGLGEVLLGLALGPLLLLLYDVALERCALVHWPTGAAATGASTSAMWLVALLAADLGYWMFHRASHRVAALWAIHGVHHQSSEFNISVAVRHPWLSDTYAAPFYAHCVLLGIPTDVFFLAISAISFYSLTIHAPLLSRPSWKVFVTPRTHVLHHAGNAPYAGNNLGAWLTIWDRLFGTHVEPVEGVEPVIGLPGGVRTHDGALSQWVLFADLVERSRSARGVGELVRVWLGAPRFAGPSSIAPARAERDIPPAVRAYCAVQATLLIVGGAWVLWWRSAHSATFLVVGAVVLFVGIASVGALLDGRRGAARFELARLAATAGVLGWLLTARD